ncbi:hypothetical protein IMZ48_00470 [Candidatus Bathyarchaeota archaeon]|nr:hypothetical protein [Candidatus Bathyarchaeota archaeon]
MIASKWAGDLTVDGNHVDICKFGGPDDRKYRSFVNKLQQHFLSEIEAEAKLKSRVGERGVSRRNPVL